MPLYKSYLIWSSALSIILTGQFLFAASVSSPEFSCVAQMSTGIDIWRDFLLSRKPTYSGAEDFFLQPREIKIDDINSLKALLESPEGQKALAQAEQNFDNYINRLVQSRNRTISTSYPGIPLDAPGDVERSFERFIAGIQNRNRRPISDNEADRIAMAFIRNTYGVSVLGRGEPMQRRDYLRQFELAKLASESIGRQSGLTAEAWTAWKHLEVTRLRNARVSATHEMVRLVMEVYPNEILIGQADARGILDINEPKTRSLRTDELSEATFFEVPFKLNDKDFLAVRGSSFGVSNLVHTNLRIRLRDGSEYALASRSQGGYEGYKYGPKLDTIVGYFPLPMASDPRYFRQNLTSLDRQIKLEMIDHAIYTRMYSSMVEKNLSGINYGYLVGTFDFVANIDELRKRVGFFKKYSSDQFNSQAIRQNLRLAGHYRTSDRISEHTRTLNRGLALFWLHGDPMIWRQRDHLANSPSPPTLGTPIPVENISSTNSYGFHTDPLMVIENFGSSYGRGVLNQGYNAHTKNNKDTTVALRTSQIPGIKAIFYELPDEDVILKGEPYRMPQTAGSIQVETELPLPENFGHVFIATPLGHVLSNLKIKTPDGRELVYGRDFEMLKQPGRNTFSARLANSTLGSAFHYTAEFVASPIQIDQYPEFLMDIPVLPRFYMANDLRKGGLTTLAGEMEKLVIRGGKVSIFDILKAMKTSLYSYNSNVGSAEVIKNATGPFAKYAKFVNSLGVACYQCDGANTLFRDILKQLFNRYDIPKMDILITPGYLVTDSKILAKSFHLATGLVLEGYPPIHLDATPNQSDGWVPPPKSLVEVEAIPTAPMILVDLQRVDKFKRELKAKVEQLERVVNEVRFRTDEKVIWLPGQLGNRVLQFISGRLDFLNLASEVQKFS